MSANWKTQIKWKDKHSRKIAASLHYSPYWSGLVETDGIMSWRHML